MQPHEFSWTKLLCFFGAAFAVFIGFATVSSGIGLILAERVTNGVFTILGGIFSLGFAVFTYLYYIRVSDKDLPGKKLK